jgi:hypothetical protein
MACQKSKQLEWFSGSSQDAAKAMAAPFAAWPWSFVATLLCVYLIPISSVALNLEGVLSSTFRISRPCRLSFSLFR